MRRPETLYKLSLIFTAAIPKIAVEKGGFYAAAIAHACPCRSSSH